MTFTDPLLEAENRIQQAEAAVAAAPAAMTFTDPLFEAENRIQQAEAAVAAAPTATAKALARREVAKAVNARESALYDADPEAYRLREDDWRAACAHHDYCNA